MFSYTRIPYAATGRFSQLVADYLAGAPAFGPLQQYSPDAAGLAEAVAARSQRPIDRAALVALLQEQYAGEAVTAAVGRNIAALAEETTLTVCTAHQPNLGTGYLYFIYKILHAIKLAAELESRHPGHRFVPVYYMGSEDADLDELGTFRYAGKKYVWDAAGQTGAVGRMQPAGLRNLLDDLFRVMGPPGPYLEELQQLLSDAYLQHDTIAAATRHLVHALFGRYGLVVLDPDDARLKKAFVPVMEDELLHSQAARIVEETTTGLSAAYGLQAAPREINLFYLRDALRERIERDGERWTVVGTDIAWDRGALLEVLYAHPERFSPNVILRPLYQETILPNVAFIGGGAEVAYWLELKAVFARYAVFYPAVLLRQSVWWLDKPTAARLGQLGLRPEEAFRESVALERRLVDLHAPGGWDPAPERAALQALMQALSEKAVLVDSTLEGAAAAALKRMEHQLEVLEKKMVRAHKRRLSVPLQRLEKVRAQAFPGGGLQERVGNFMDFYLQFGPAWFDALLDGMEPLAPAFLIVEERP